MVSDFSKKWHRTNRGFGFCVGVNLAWEENWLAYDETGMNLEVHVLIFWTIFLDTVVITFWSRDLSVILRYVYTILQVFYDFKSE